MVVTLTRRGKKVLSVYVRARKSATVRSIPDGSYRLFWMAGYRYSSSKRRFLVGAIYRRSFHTLSYTTIGNSYRTYTLTLRMSKYGGGSSQPINPRNFPV